MIEISIIFCWNLICFYQSTYFYSFDIERRVGPQKKYTNGHLCHKLKQKIQFNNLLKKITDIKSYSKSIPGDAN